MTLLLRVDFSYQCHREKDPEGCQRLADYMEGVKENVESTTQVLKHNCEMNKHGEVVKLTMFYISPPGEVADNLKMAYCFMTAYSSGGKKSVDACQNVGLLTDVAEKHTGHIRDKNLSVMQNIWGCSEKPKMQTFILSLTITRGNFTGISSTLVDT
uniref:Cytochrome c oxidase assembly factor 7 n=1 Tax=Oncorhynchus kisutch TaxID=8019 RepID=A0A8C7GBI1_ONCKI